MTTLPVSSEIRFSDMATAFSLPSTQIRLGDFQLQGDPILPRSNEQISLTNFKGRRYTIQFHIDGANTLSYPGTGSTITDITPNSYPGSLITATYDATSQGFVFNGSGSIQMVTNNTIPIRNNLPTTIQILFNWDGNISSIRGLLGYRGSDNTSNPIHIELTTGGLRTRIGAIELTGTAFPVANKNVLLSIVYTGSAGSNITNIYYDKVLVRSESAVESGDIYGEVTGTSATSGFHIGESLATTDATRIFTGTIYNAMLHMTALTENEINATVDYFVSVGKL